MARTRARLVGLVVALATSTALLVVAASGPAHAVDYKPWGRAWSSDKALKRGCHTYYYRYRVDVPAKAHGNWMAEIFLVNPDGVHLTHSVRDGDFHADEGRRPWRPEICRSSTRFGRHKVKMKVTWWEDDPQMTMHTGWVKPTYFRFYRP